MKKSLLVIVFFLLGKIVFSQNYPVRINVGSDKDFTDSEGNIWKADTNFNLNIYTYETSIFL